MLALPHVGKLEDDVPLRQPILREETRGEGARARARADHEALPHEVAAQGLLNQRPRLERDVDAAGVRDGGGTNN